MKTALTNWWTTIFGILAAVGQYATQVGGKAPTNRNEWIATIGAALLAALGYVAKDATTGSKPGA